MSYSAAFSPDYPTARSRFRHVAAAAGARLQSHRIDAPGPGGVELSIDVAVWGESERRRAVVVSSGLHGVEGLLGSAVQAAWLEERFRRDVLPGDTRLVMLHGLNPFGFAWRRRVNEDNVDLNRNFLLPGGLYAGAPPHYGALDGLLNPPSPPGGCEPLRLKAALAELRLGRGVLLQTLPVGQHDFPKGLFFGGQGPSQTHRIVADNFPRWLAGAEEVLHVDLHSGLGPWGGYVVWPSGPVDSPQALRLRELLGGSAVGKYYPSRGAWGAWCEARFAGRRYRFATAEFGTYSQFRVGAALRAENRAHFWCSPGDPRLDRARAELVEVFAPSDPRWRDAALRQGLALLDRAVQEV